MGCIESKEEASPDGESPAMPGNEREAPPAPEPVEGENPVVVGEESARQAMEIVGVKRPSVASDVGMGSQKTRQGKRPSLQISIPKREGSIFDDPIFDKFLTRSGRFVAGDLILDEKGWTSTSEANRDQPRDGEGLDCQFSLDELQHIKNMGRGSSGVVRLTFHRSTGRLFALKVIVLTSVERTLQLVRELKINHEARCPHVVTCYNSFYRHMEISLLIEYMDRGSLGDVIRQLGKIPEPYLATICKQIVMGLVYLHHEMNLIHRDIKPSNLLVNERGEVKIADFGVSAVLDRASAMGRRVSVTGSQTYMSPERINEERYDQKSDVWSLGIVALECATGRFPYKSADPRGWKLFELREAIFNGPVPSPSPDEFSPEFCSFIAACLQKDPRDRMPSLELLEHAFIRKFEGEEVDLGNLLSRLEPPVSDEVIRRVV